MPEEKSIIQVNGLGKCYKIYDSPQARLKQSLWRGRKQYYRDFWALRNVSFEVGRGESIGIIGRNGSGKSTLLQMICGTLAPTEGFISTTGSIAALLELGSGFNPEFSGIENVYLNASLLGLSNQQTEERLEDIKAFADIGNFINQPVKTYSSGMLVRLAFAVVAHVESSVLIVDEALSVGDSIFGQRCMRFIRRFTETGTLFFVSHDLNSVSGLCERAIWIDSGSIRMDSSNKEAVKAYTRYCQQSAQEEAAKRPDRIAEPTKYQKPVSSAAGIACDTDTQGSETERTDVHQRNTMLLVAARSNCAELANWNSGEDYGNGHAMITEASLINADGEATMTPCCGDYVSLMIRAQCNQPVRNFMAGFIIRDKTGLLIFGDNNIQAHELHAVTNEFVGIDFSFTMPFLHPGPYCISVAISEDDPDMPTVMHYKPDYILIEPITGKRIIHGVFGIRDMTISSKVGK